MIAYMHFEAIYISIFAFVEDEDEKDQEKRRFEIIPFKMVSSLSLLLTFNFNSDTGRCIIIRRINFTRLNSE